MDWITCAGVLVDIDYTNWRGERRWRTIQPLTLVFKVSDYHTGAQWFIQATNYGEETPVRDFALNNIHAIRRASI